MIEITNELIRKAITAAINAGKSILEIYEKKNFEVSMKENNSPLTEADEAAHTVICDILGNDYPVLSEEGKKLSYETRRSWKTFWMVDPLDGTKEFIKRNGEFTVNIALIHDSEPVLGIVLVPVTDEMYIGVNSGKKEAFKLDNASKTSVSQWKTHAESISPAELQTDTVSVVASRSHMNAETKEYINCLEKRYKEVRTSSFGSSLKLCKVAEGSADVYPRFAPTMEWDTAAADAVCRAAGAEVLDIETGQALRYNKENLLNPWFCVSSIKDILLGITE